jgi:hypothetical protein
MNTSSLSSYLNNNSTITSISVAGTITATGQIAAASFNATSDQRLKSTVTDIVGCESLEIVRNIEPKTYNFIQDDPSKAPTAGFIAQNIKNHISYAVTESVNYVPNIYEYAFVCSGSIVKLDKKTTDDICMNNLPVKLKFRDHSNIDFIRNIASIIDDKSFSLTEPIDLSDCRLFLYGQEVADFCSLNYNSIFTVVTAAVKELDREHEKTKQIVREQQIVIENLQKQIDAINRKLFYNDAA